MSRDNPVMVPLTGYKKLSEAEMRKRVLALHEGLKTRRSVREFSDQAVPIDIIKTALATAGGAPSGANHQPWHFVAISNPEIKAKIRKAAEAEEAEFYNGRAPKEWIDALAPLGTNESKPFLETAPWLIAIFAQRRGGVTSDDNRKNYYVSESVGIATGFLISSLHAAGLGTLTHTPAPMSFLTQICERPKDEKPFLLLVVGYPKEGAKVPAHALIKKPLKDISTFLN